jgi:glutamyl-tRNA synthetase
LLRFAPSPTQDFSIGKLRIAIFNYILAKQKNEKLLIRIEDIEKEKNIEGKDKEILELLALFSIDYEHAIYESENLKYHQKLAMQLMTNKKAFACFCSNEKLNELRKKAEDENQIFSYDGFCQNLSDETVLNVTAPFTVRAVKPQENIKFNDLFKGELSYTPDEVDSFFILNHDKTPTYNYACAIDDMLYDISTIIREDIYLEDTPRQIHLRTLLGYTKNIDYIHIPTINEQISVKELIDEGFLPSAIANYLVLLGTNTPTEIFTLEEAIEWFNIKSLSKETVVFDINKLKEINKKHLETIDNMRLSKIIGFADEDIGKLAKLFLEEVETIKEIKEKINLIFSPKSTCIGFEEQFVELKLSIQDAPYFDDFNQLNNYITEKTGLKDEELSKTLKCILIGSDTKVKLSDIYPLIKNYLGEIIK